MTQRTVRLTLALAAAAMMVVPSVVTAQTVMSEFTDVRYMGEEGLTPAGTVPNGEASDPSTTYDADSNGLNAAFAGTTFEIVLNGKYINRLPGSQTQYDTDRALLLATFLSNERFMTPGFGQFRAFYGAWADQNQDKYLQDSFLDENRPIQIAVPEQTSAGYKDCTQTLSTTDTRGGFRPVGGRQGGNTNNPNTGVSYRCNDADEWKGLSGAEIVAYVTPDSYQDFANNVFGDASPGISPDFKYTSPGANVNPENGSYFAPTSNFDVIITDNSLLQTTVVESIAEPKFTLTDERLFEKNATAPLAQGFLRTLRADVTLTVPSRVDVDVYASLSPALETLYFNNVNSKLRTANLYPDDPDRSARILFVTALAAAAPTVGPTFATVVPRQTPELNQFTLANYQAGYHMYLDMDVKESQSFTTTQVSWTSEQTETLSPGMNGKQGVLTYLSVFGIMGAWRDVNVDGFIGNPVTASGCTDAHNCGMRPDPSSTHGGSGSLQAVPDSSEYGAANSNKEFVPRGRVYTGAAGPDSDGINERVCEIAVTLTSSSGAWGPVGAYVFSDRSTPANYATGGDVDEYERDGRSSFAPYDDMVIDVTSDVFQPDTTPDSDSHNYGGTTGAGPIVINRLVTAGPIVVKAKSSGCGGGYSGYENIALPGGNRAFDIRAATPVFQSTFFDVGIQTPEDVWDADCLPRWDGGASTCGLIRN